MKNLYSKFYKKFISSFLCLLLFINVCILNTPSYSLTKQSFGKDALKHIEYLSKTPRVSGTKLITPYQQYIKNEFQKYGYDVYEQNFEWPLKNSKKSSQNIIASKKGLNNKQIIIGAHYDSTNYNGADDNASGVSALLELSQKLSNIILPYNIKFITFDAEELGLFGSRYFVKNMNEEERSNTILYINIDSILSGDNLYIYGDTGYRGWFRDKILDIACEKNIEIKTSPGINKTRENSIEIPKGECFDYSDHVYFKYAGIPYAYFESTSWENVNEFTGYPEYRNEKFGMVLHSINDNLDFILNNLKNKPINNLSNCVYLLYEALVNPQDSITITTNVNPEIDLKKISYELYKNNNTLIKTLTHDNSNRIKVKNLPKGKYKIKQINNSNVKFSCNMDDKPFDISNNGNFDILYEDINLIPKTRDYDKTLIEIYGDNFNHNEPLIDDYKNEVLPAFSQIDSETSNKSSNSITKFLTSILISILYSNIYSLQKGKLL